MPLSFFVLAIFFVFTSFAFGCMENWSIATAEVILFLGAGISGYVKKGFFKWPEKLSPLALFVAVMAAVCLIQLIPLPVSFWRGVDSDRVQSYEKGRLSEELLHSETYRKDPFETINTPEEKERYSPQTPSYMAISYAPIQTLRSLLAFVSFLCFLFLLEDVSRDGTDKLRLLAYLVGSIGLVIGLIALAEKGIENRTHVLWLRESSRAAFAFGPFINGNHGEAFINLTFPLICYLLWRKSNHAEKLSDKIGMRSVIVSLLVLQGALVISGSSKGNFLTLALIPVAFLLHYGFSKNRRYLAIAGIIMLVTLALAVVLLFQSGLLTDEVRVSMNANILSRVIFSGYGFGSFGEVFPAMVTDWPMFRPMRNVYLENEYLQLYIEAGMVMIPFVLILITAILLACYGSLKRHGAVFWLFPPLASEVFRAWVDMSFHIFPLAAVYVLIFSLTVAGRE